MNKRLFLVVVLPIMVVAAVLVVPQIRPAHANPFTGTVCIQDFTSVPVTDPVPCNHVLSGTTPVAPTFDGPFVTPNHQVQIGLYVNGSDQLNGWDITLKVDHTLLVPAFRSSSVVDPTHSIVGPENIPGASLSVIVLCVQGISVTGTCLSTDGIDTLHYSVVGGKTIASPSSGLLFTALYNITGKTPAGGITIGYQTGCAGAVSVPGECITILSGTPIPDNERAMTATFDNSATPSTGGTGTAGVPFITITSSAPSLTLLVGQSGSVTLTATAQNGWPGPALCAPPTPGCSTDSVLFTEMHSTGLSVGLAPGTTCSTGGTTCSTPAISIKAPATSGFSFVTFFANYVANSFTTGQNNTLVAPITIGVTVTDFSWALSPNTVNVVSGAPAAMVSTGTVTSLNGFAGTVGVSSVPVAGLTVAFTPTSVPVTAGGSGTTQISLSTAAAAGTVFTVSTRATTTGLVTAKTAVLHVTVVSGGPHTTSTAVTCTLASVIVGTATSCSATVTDTSSSPTNPTGTVTFSNGGASGSFSSTTCTLTNSGTSAATCAASVSYTPSAVGTGTQSITGSYGGDSTHATSPSPAFTLTVTKASPNIATTLSATAITAGGSVTDSATLTGGFQAVGTVTYEFFSGSACAGTATTVGTPVTVTNGVVPGSASQTFGTAGPFSWNAVYSGDANNNGMTSACEPLTVGAAGDFSLTPASSTVTFTIGSSGTDTISVASLNNFAGTVSFTLAPTPATGLTGSCSSVTLTAGATLTSNCSFSATLAGSYSVVVTGSGGSPTITHTAPLSVTVNKANPTITTTLSASTITVGGSVTDAATLTNGFQAGGTVTYEFFAGSACAGTATTVGTPVTVTNGAIPASASQTFGTAGPFSWNAIYSGDQNNLGKTSACEPLTVSAAADFSLVPASSTVSFTIGGTGTDSISVASLNSFAGTVSFTVAPTPSTGLTGSCSSVTLTAGGTQSSICTFSATLAGSYSVVVTGSGGSPVATHTVPLAVTVNKAAPTITTSLSSSSVAVGGSVTDSATLTGGFQAGGTVTYEFFSGSTCAGTATTVGTPVTVIGGVVPNSASQLFNTAGSFSWNAIYSGDANNVGPVTSACEPLSVTGAADFSLTATSATVTFAIGASGSDSISVMSLNSFAGSVSFTVTSTPSTGLTGSCSSVTLTAGATLSSNCTFGATLAGSYSVVVTGSGGSPTVTHTVPFSVTVNKASPTIATTLSATTITVGGSVSDSASISGGFQAGGTVTYEFFSGSTCTGTATTVGTPVTVINGVVPGSASQAFNTAGSFSWNAIYSGDINNNGKTSACEPLTVNAAADFSLTVSSTTVSFTAGQTGTDTIAVAGSGGFADTISFTSSITPSTGLTVACTSVTLTATITTGTSNCTFSSSTPGSYTVVITGTGATSTLSHKVTITVTVTTAVKNSPTISTSLSATNIIIRGSVTDSAVLTGATATAGGTVTYNEFNGGACGGTPMVVSTVTVTNGIVPNSASVTPVSPGSYSFNALYSGDANNNPAASSCEPLTVNKASPQIATSLSASTIVVGASVSDSAILTGATANAGGTVAYNLFTSGTCSGTATVISNATVTNGRVPASASHTFNTTGSFGWKAVYSGDSNNNGATSACEPLTVTSVTTADFTISASPTSLTVQPGDRATSRITLKSLGFAGTVTLTVTVSPRLDQGIRASLRVYQITLAVNRSDKTTLIVRADDDALLGGYAVTVTGTSGALSHSVKLNVTVANEDEQNNVVLLPGTSSLAIAQDAAGSVTLTIESQGFKGTVALDADVLSWPHGLSVSVVPARVSLDSGAATATLKITVDDDTPLGTYTIIVTANNGSQMQFVQIALTVTQ